MNTMIELVEWLKNLKRDDLTGLIYEALTGEFHDYKNEKYAAPKMVLVQKLKEKGLENIAQDVIQGMYDEE